MHLQARMPASRMASRGHMDLRIARKVAALHGIPGDPDSSDDAGRGRAWLSNYALLTATELAIGGPLRSGSAATDGGVFTRVNRRLVHDDGDVDPAVLPNVTLAEYGPDTKAALTLTGVNKILEPVADAVREALTDVFEQVDSPVLVVAVGQCLLQEVFAAQPFLVLSGMQAGQVQRALSLPGRMVARTSDPHRPLARVEFGYDHKQPLDPPLHLTIVHQLWESVIAPGDTFDGGGTLGAAGSGLRAKPLFAFEQNDIVGVMGDSHGRQRLLSVLCEASEASLLGSSPGSPRTSVHVLDGGDRGPQIEVVVPRQRQIDLMLALLAPRLSRQLHAEPIPAGAVLRLPRIDVDRWRDTPLLHRRAALLAHYYSLRAAGWISGMTRFDHRRNRDECAARCSELVGAAAELLDPSDPLRDILSAYGLGYHLQHAASFGGGTATYRGLSAVLDHMLTAVHAGRLPRATVIEFFPLVLDNLRAARRAVTHGLLDEPGEAELTLGLRRWWDDVRKIRAELIERADERRFLDNAYTTSLLDDASSDDEIREGLELSGDVIGSRRDEARREGRWVAVRMGLLSYLRGLCIALERRIDPDQVPGRAAAACRVAAELADHVETRHFLAQRTSAPAGHRPSYDGAALVLLITLVRAWLAALRSGKLDPADAAQATRSLGEIAPALTDYLLAVRGCPDDGHGRSTSRLDPLRDRMAEVVLADWRRWADQ